jgi:carbamoyltransferase
MDIAAGMQAALQHATLHLLRHFKHETGLTHLCLAGGVTLNCVMNGVIARNAELGRLVNNGWIQLFAMNESGEVAMAYAGDLKWRELRPPSQTLAA